MTSGSLNAILLWTGILIAILGAAAVLFALFRDRARGRRRCPKCWYDMKGTPGLRCPECGKSVRHEKRFSRTRRRWRLAFLALVMTLAGVAMAVTPGVRARGWWSVVPTSVLVLLAPARNPPMYFDTARSLMITDGYATELSRRFNSGKPWAWQWRRALVASELVTARSTWPVDEPFAVRVRLPEWLMAESIELTAELPGASPVLLSNVLARRSWHTIGNLPAGTKHVRVRAVIRAGVPNPLAAAMFGGPGGVPAGGVPPVPQLAKGVILYSGAFTLPVRAVDSLPASMTPVKGPEIDELVRAAMRVRVGWASEGKSYRGGWTLVSLDRDKLGPHSMIALPITVEVVRNGEVLSSAPTSLGMSELAIVWRIERRPVSFPSAVRRALEEPGDTKGWVIRVRGELPEMHEVWQRETYWQGTLDFPLQDVLRGPWQFDVNAWADGRKQPE